ncbi:MAG: hypothetical protein RIT81_34260 [Deltaproteobacteria bacterium]
MVIAQPLALSLALGLVAAPAPDERAMLRSDRPGSLAKPSALTVDALKQLCGEEPSAIGAVYRTRIGPTGFDFRSYAEGALPLALDRPLLALDGAALLSADERDAAFTIDATRADRAKAQRAAKALELEVTFRLAEAEAGALASCFTKKGSGQWALHVEALAYRLVPAEGDALAQLETEAMKRLAAWVRPGDAKVRIEARALDAAVDEERATVAVAAARDKIESCTASAREAITDPVTMAYLADVDASGRITAARAELVTADLDTEVGCIEAALVGTELQKARAAYHVRIVVALDRPGFEALYW